MAHVQVSWKIDVRYAGSADFIQGIKIDLWKQ